MLAIPAIDLKDGQVVRLFQGKFDSQTTYAEKPEEVAKRFEEEGAKRIHLVDLDGALKGTPKNQSAVERILKKVRVPCEIGGGIRSLDVAEEYLRMGLSWVILGTKACLDRGFLKEAVGEFKEKVILGLDAKDGLIATDGWTKVTKEKAAGFAVEAEKIGVRQIIYTDISKDGALKGPNLSEIENLAKSIRADVIASGGIGSLKDIEALRKLKQPNISGVIVGKAIYEKKFSVSELVKACSQNA